MCSKHHCLVSCPRWGRHHKRPSITLRTQLCSECSSLTVGFGDLCMPYRYREGIIQYHGRNSTNGSSGSSTTLAATRRLNLSHSSRTDSQYSMLFWQSALSWTSTFAPILHKQPSTISLPKLRCRSTLCSTNRRCRRCKQW